MPIYIQFDGIKGDVSPSAHRGGANVGMLDGSVKHINRSVNPGGGPRVTVYTGSDNSGVGRIPVSGISLRNAPGGTIRAGEANAVMKARALFEGKRNLVVSQGLIVSLARSGANKMVCANNLRQLSLAAQGQMISAIRLVITDGGNQQGVAIELENVLITNYSISGHGGATQASKLFREALAGEGKKVKIDFCKT